MVLNFIPVTNSQLFWIDLAHQFDRRFLVLEHQHDRHDGHFKRFAMVPTSNRNCQRSEKMVTDLKRVGASVGGDKPSCLLSLCKHILLDHAVRLFICLIVTPMHNEPSLLPLI